jgi:hypothetical protein
VVWCGRRRGQARRRRSSARTGLSAALALPVALSVGATGAGAGQPVVQTPFSGSGSYVESHFCGVTVQVNWTETGTTVVRPVKDSGGQAYYGHATFHLTEVISTAAGFVTIVTRKVFHEQRATHLQGDVWRFEWLDAGTFSVYDASGKVLLRASGAIKAAQELDTFGDGAPGGQPVGDTLEVTSVRGRTIGDGALCDAVLPLLS